MTAEPLTAPRDQPSHGARARRNPEDMTRHIFDDDTCTRCGASLYDQPHLIGCEAEGPTNPDGYLGFAVTATEQRAGITDTDKFAWMFHGALGNALSAGDLEARLRGWNEAVLRDVGQLAAEARAVLEERRRNTV